MHACMYACMYVYIYRLPCGNETWLAGNSYQPCLEAVFGVCLLGPSPRLRKSLRNRGSLFLEVSSGPQVRGDSITPPTYDGYVFECI